MKVQGQVLQAYTRSGPIQLQTVVNLEDLILETRLSMTV